MLPWTKVNPKHNAWRHILRNTVKWTVAGHYAFLIFEYHILVMKWILYESNVWHNLQEKY